ncbi:hypothetical protein R1sor_003810 [Riccia sorocarpa]|uniref:PPPDE domain-containing protein n=1 Tax=Riccia sorocarpa TaxID=122646 RepID=A0ABD3H2P4_9MARC
MRTSVPTTESDGSGATSHVPVYLNVYDLTPMNGYVYWVGMGIFHSGIEVHGSEYAFGAHDFPTSGVFEVEPRSCPGFTFRRSILMGTTGLSPQEIRNFIETVADDYNGNTYQLLVKNCNHFTNDVCSRLLGKGIPGWVNRLAGVGVFCSCLLPESLKVPAADEDFEGSEQKLARPLTTLSNGLVDNLSSKESAEEDPWCLLLSCRGDSFAWATRRPDIMSLYRCSWPSSLTLLVLIILVSCPPCLAEYESTRGHQSW